MKAVFYIISKPPNDRRAIEIESRTHNGLVSKALVEFKRAVKAKPNLNFILEGPDKEMVADTYDWGDTPAESKPDVVETDFLGNLI